MPKIAQRQNNIGGLTPSIHNGQAGEIRVLSGRNFRWNYDGPFSGWGNKVVSNPFEIYAGSSYVGLFHFNDMSIVCTPNGIYQATGECSWQKVLELTPAKLEACDADYPWTQAFVGDSYYFSHPTIGIISYSMATCTWEICKLTDCSSGNCGKEVEQCEAQPIYYDFNFGNDNAQANKKEYQPVYGITEAGNRLIVLSKDTIGHSEIDNGCNLECDPFCGGGFVSSSIAKYGKPLAVHKVGNGFAVFTSNAIVHAVQVESLAAFTYRATSYNTTAINPYAITPVAESFDLVFLAKSGLKTLSLNRETLVIQDFQPEVSAWLIEKELVSQNYISNQHGVRLGFNEERNELFVSLTAQDNRYPDFNDAYPNLYTRALVLNLKYDKWSSFDQPHYLFGPVNGLFHRGYVTTFGFFGGDTCLHWFNESKVNELYVGNDKQEIMQFDLDSFISIGPFSVGSDNLIDVTSEIQKIKIFTEGNINFDTSEVIEAYHPELTETKDNYQGFNNRAWLADVTIKSSLDAYSRLYNMQEQVAVPDVNSASEFIKTYSCKSTGLYHTVTIKTSRDYAFYHVKRIDVQLLTVGTIA